MCVQSQYAPAVHGLLAAYGKNWSERHLVMFVAYVDDSGTAPSQKVAIATALIIPAIRLLPFQSEWSCFAKKHGVSDFHASECAVANPKSDFAGWDAAAISSAFGRIRQITKKYAAKCFSLAVNKPDYDALVPLGLRPAFGQFHYTWAIHSLLSLLDGWACQSGMAHPLEYVFDWIDPKSQRDQKQEIENALARNETERPGRFAGHYSFRQRTDYPGLQCVDLLGWTCYRYALNTYAKIPLTKLQRECWEDFSSYRKEEWLLSLGQTRQQLQDCIEMQKRKGTSSLSSVAVQIDPA